MNTAVVALLEDADGPVGLGYAPTFGFGTQALRSHIADDFVPRILRKELRDTQDAIATMIDAASISGRPAGSARLAIALMEMALFDIEGQLAGVPLHQLWGHPTQPVSVYASGGWRFFDVDELMQFVRQQVRDGFDAVKIQVGLSPEEDAIRVRTVRDMVGPDVRLMLDANQRIPSDLAVDWIAALTPFSPIWLEEPCPAADHECLASLRSITNVPIAAGESETEPTELADLLSRQAVDVIQPDIYRVGLSATRAICGRAMVDKVVVAPHMAHEVSAHVLSGASDDAWLEYFDWFEDWWEIPVMPSGGKVAPANVPGHGLRLRSGWLQAHSL
jgi:L-alanine-DL-glutamate epimerase-like enolase superfamily enzyme